MSKAFESMGLDLFESVPFFSFTYIAGKWNSEQKHSKPRDDVNKSSMFSEFVWKFINHCTGHSLEHAELKQTKLKESELLVSELIGNDRMFRQYTPTVGSGFISDTCTLIVF